MNFKLFLSGILFCGIALGQSCLYAKSPVMPELSAEEQEQLLEQQMVLNQILMDILKDFIAHNLEAVDWLLLHATKEQKKAADLIMALVKKYMMQEGRGVIEQWSRHLGVKLHEKKAFVEEMSHMFGQLLPIEFEKWVLLSSTVGLRRSSR